MRVANLLAWTAFATFLLAACRSGEADRETIPTPKAIAEFTTIDFAKIPNYSSPELPPYFDETVAALDNTPDATATSDRIATVGRVLFYDLRMSTNDRASCASCHQPQYGFTDPMRLSNGISSAATTEFHSMRLGNIRYWQPGSAFWDRRVKTIEAQVSEPIHSLVELGWNGAAGKIDKLIAKLQATPYYPELFAWAYGDPTVTEARVQDALAQFLRSMVTAQSKWDVGYAKVFKPDAPDRALDVDLPNFTAQENRGRYLFMTGTSEGGAGCAACHLPPTFALSADSRSNGLDAGEDTLFKAPSLRNAALTGPYMHDGRFDTLAQVIAFYDQGIQPGPALDSRLMHKGRPQRLGLSQADRDALVAFIGTLSDENFTSDERFSDPFRR